MDHTLPLFPPPTTPAATPPLPSRRRSPRGLQPSLNSAGADLESDLPFSAGASTALPPSQFQSISNLDFSWTPAGTLLAAHHNMPHRPLAMFGECLPPDIFECHTPAIAPHALLSYALATPTLNLDSDGRPLTYARAIAGPNRPAWIEADVVELVKLVHGTGTLKPTHSPPSKPTYYNRVVKEKLKADGVERRVRGTAGGDKLTFPYSLSSSTASMTSFKIFLNGVVSADSNLASADLSDFFLGADLPNPESIKIYTDTFDADTLLSLGFTPFIKTDKSGKSFVYCEICKSMYGLGSASLLSQLRLIAQLHAHDYIQTETPCIFRHKTRNISFCLVVDDFCISYTDIADLQHFSDSLAELYHIKVYPTCTDYLGFTIVYDRVARTITLSCPDYIPDLLTRLQLSDIPTAKSPCIYVPPIFGSKEPQKTRVDASPQLSPDQASFVQIVVGSLLCYARAVDATLLTAVCLLSSQQSSPTAATLTATMRLLGYAKLHSARTLVYKPSDMLLRIHSDASYLNRAKSGSTAGGFHFLGSLDEDFLNGPIFCCCTLIPVVCAAVSEAEYAALYANCQVAIDERRTCCSIGHPQPPTNVVCDNECAVGLATETIRPRKSKAIDMRFDWTRDRVRQGQFTVTWISGPLNKGDFFTKALPVHTHQALAPLYSHAPTLTAAVTDRLISDTGATHILLRRSSFPSFSHLFSPKVLPSLTFSLPDGASLHADGSLGGSLKFPHRRLPVDCYVCPDSSLSHNLVGVSPLLRPDGHAIYTPTDVRFFSSDSPEPFLAGSKAASDDLWCLQFPRPI